MYHHSTNNHQVTMLAFGALSVALLGLTHSVSAHGYLKSIEVNGASYLAWQVFQDDFVTPEPTRYARRIQDNGYVLHPLLDVYYNN